MECGIKRKLDEATLSQLAQDPDESVRHRVACNANTPRAILEFLMNDPSPMVVETAEERLAEKRWRR